MDVTRVLHVLGGLNIGGAESRVMDLYRNIDRTKVQFDFLIHTNDNQHYEQEAKLLGANIYHIPKFNLINYFSYKRSLNEFFKKNHKFAIVHGHMTSTASIYGHIAHKYNLKIIAHARSAGVRNGIIKLIIVKILSHSLRYNADYLFACSKVAGNFLFGKKRVNENKVKIINNAINVHAYTFDIKKRIALRKELGIENKYVIGHVGMFCDVKNHKFILEIMKELVDVSNEYLLLLVGDGELRQQIMDTAKRLQISDNVILVGNKKNVNDYYQAMDFFVLPSFFEGLPGVVIEAQTAGLKCIVSDTVTDEVKITELVLFNSIKKPAYEWAKQICMERNYERRNTYEDIVNAGYNVLDEVKKIQDFYLKRARSKI